MSAPRTRIPIRFQMSMCLDAEKGGTMVWVDKELGLSKMQFTPTRRKQALNYGPRPNIVVTYHFRGVYYADTAEERLLLIAAVEADPDALAVIEAREKAQEVSP